MLRPTVQYSKRHLVIGLDFGKHGNLSPKKSTKIKNGAPSLQIIGRQLPNKLMR